MGQSVDRGHSMMWGTPIMEWVVQPSEFRQAAAAAAAESSSDVSVTKVLSGWAEDAGIQQVHEVMQMIGDLGVDAFDAFLDTHPQQQGSDVATANHGNEAFFRWQRTAAFLEPPSVTVGNTFLDGNVHFSSRHVAALRLVRCMVEIAGAALLPPSTSQVGPEGRVGQMGRRWGPSGQHGRAFMWLGVHDAGSAHLPHTHSGSAVSGTLYLVAPPGCGSLALEDPRAGGRPPFDGRRFVRPSVGKMVLFPGWLVHHVTPSQANEEGLPRVALSFNLPGQWSETSDMNVSM